MPSLGGIDVVTQAGALKKQDWTLMNEFTGPANEGPENDRLDNDLNKPSH